jgi:toxin CcdB
MAQFDVHRREGRDILLLNCQSDVVDHLASRLVVPLVPLGSGMVPSGRLNPVFMVDDRSYQMLTQSAAAVRLRELGPPIASLAGHRDAIITAFDLLLTGL